MGRQGGKNRRYCHHPFQRPADAEKPPTGKPVHVFMNEPGKAVDLAQQNAHRPCGVIALGQLFSRPSRCSGKIVRSHPAVDGEPVADLAGAFDRSIQGLQQAFGDAIAYTDPDPFEMVRIARASGVSGSAVSASRA